jgi:hypothetical protein
MAPMRNILVDYYDTNWEMTKNGCHFKVLCEMAELGPIGAVCPLLIIPIIFYHTSIYQHTQPAFSLVISLVIPVIFDHQLNQPLPPQIPSFPISS